MGRTCQDLCGNTFDFSEEATTRGTLTEPIDYEAPVDFRGARHTAQHHRGEWESAGCKLEGGSGKVQRTTGQDPRDLVPQVDMTGLN